MPAASAAGEGKFTAWSNDLAVEDEDASWWSSGVICNFLSDTLLVGGLGFLVYSG
jgi:hypothetical protein